MESQIASILLWLSHKLTEFVGPSSSVWLFVPPFRFDLRRDVFHKQKTFLCTLPLPSHRPPRPLHPPPAASSPPFRSLIYCGLP